MNIFTLAFNGFTVRSGIKKILLFTLLILALLSANATNYFNISFTGASDANNVNNWTTSGSGGAGTKPSAMNETGATFTIRSNAAQTMFLSANLDIGGNTFVISSAGVLDCKAFVLSGITGSVFTLSNGGTLMIGNTLGITTSGSTGNIQTATRTYPQTGIYVYDGTTNQVTGNGLPTTVGALTISNTGTTGNNIVSLTTSGLTIESGNFSGGSGTGILTLSSGVFQIGTGNTVYFNNNSAGTNGITNNGGDFSVTNNGADGGTIILMHGSGGAFTFNGTGVTHLYNIFYGGAAGTAVGSASRAVKETNASTVVINGTLVFQDNNANWNTNAPIYGPASTLYINNNGQGFSPGIKYGGWSATSGYVIGTTPGYPNNVTLVNAGTSSASVGGINVGVNINSGYNINGVLSIGDGTTSGVVGISSNGFTCGGITINNGSQLGANQAFTVKGNWFRKGGTIGTYSNNNTTASTNTVTFAGNGPDTIGIVSGTETSFFGLTINGASTLNVFLSNPVTLPSNAAALLTLTSGVIQTSNTNILSITNTAAGAVVGGSATPAFVNGPLKRATAATGTYLFPVGSGNTGSGYLPFTIATPASSTITVTATAADAGATATFTAPITAISHTEYWTVVSSGAVAAGTITLGRQSAISPLNLVAKASTQLGNYAIVGTAPGTTSGNSIASNGTTALTSASTSYFVMATNIVGATINLTNNSGGQVAVASINKNTGNDIVYNFQAAVSGIGATLTSVGFTAIVPNGSTDVTNFKLYYSATNSFSSATQLGTSVTAILTGTNAYTFSSFSQTIAVNTTGYFWITADVPSTATTGGTIQVTPAIGSANLSFGTVTYSPAPSTTPAGVQTITAITAPSVSLANNSGGQIAIGTVNKNTIKNPVYNFQATVSIANATLSSVSFSSTIPNGSTDISNFKLYYSATNSFSAAGVIGTAITAISTGTNSYSFTGLSQTINSGSTGYFWITADVPATGTTGGTVTVAAITPANLTFTTANVTGSATGGGTQTITSTVIANIALVNNAITGQVAAATVNKNTTNNIVYNFETDVTLGNATLTGVTFSASNTLASDVTNYKLYYSATNNFSTAAAIGSTVTAIVAGGPNSYSFGTISKTINSGTSGYFWITADIPTGATTGDVIQGSTINSTNLSFTSGTITSSTTAAGAQTISATVAPNIALANNSGGQVAAAYIAIGSSKNAIYNFQTAITGSSATINAVTFATTNTSAADITAYRLYFSATNSFGAATQIGTDITTSLGTGTHTFTSLSQSIGVGTTGYFWITTNVAATATAGNTIVVSAITPVNLSFALGAATGSTSTGGLQTIASLPTVVPTGVTSITTTTATLNGTVNPNGISGNTTTYFVYGLTTTYSANTAGAATLVPSGTSAVAVSAAVSALTPNTVYHYGVTASNLLGKDTSIDASFTTLPNPPTVAAASSAVNTGFTANWAAPAILGNASYSYTLQISTDPLFGTILGSQSGITGTSYPVTGLSEATIYYYRVRTDNATGSSTWSSISAAITTTYSLGGNCPVSTGSGSPLATSGIKFTSVSTRPIIDGAIDSVWSTAYTNDMNVTWFNTDNNVARWRALYTTDSLYFLIEVGDNTLHNDSIQSGGTAINAIHPWDDDAIELTIDGGNEKSGSYDANDFQLRFNWLSPFLTGSGDPVLNNVGTTPPYASIDYKIYGTGYTPSGYVPYNPGYTSGYLVELALPWSKISSGVTAPGTVGKKIGVDFLVDNDNGAGPNSTTNSPGHDRYSGRGWYTNSTAAFNNPSVFGTAALIACDVPIVINPTVTKITATSAHLGATVSVANGILTPGGTGSAYDITTGVTSQNAAGIPGFTPTVGTPFDSTRTALAPQTHYYYVGYATNQAGTGISVVDSFYTLSALPTTQTTYGTTVATCAQITLNWSQPVFPATSLATTGGYMILRRQDGVNPTATGFVNATAPASLAFPTGTTLLTTITSKTTLTYVDATAVQGVTYTYLVVPYTWDNAHYQTYDYDTLAAPATAATLDANKTWLGTTSTDWNTASNWCGGIPDSTTNALIPTGAPRYPVLNSGTGVTKKITIQSAASVIVSGTGILSIADAIANAGTFNASTGTIRLCGTIAQVIDGSSFTNRMINNLILSNKNVSLAATAGDTLKVSGTVSFGNVNTATFTTNGNLTLTSTAAATARIADISNGGSNTGNVITGNVTIERYFPSHRSWRLVTAPIAATGAPSINASWQEGFVNTNRLSPQYAHNSNSIYGTIITKNTTSVNGYDQGSTANPSIYYFKNGAWVAPSGTSGTSVGTNSGVITDALGYMLFVRGNRNYIVATQYQPPTSTILRVTGALNQGNVGISGTGMTVIGNPYASTIYYDSIIKRGTNVPDYYYVWDPLLTGSNGVGAFITLKKTGTHLYSPTPNPAGTADSLNQSPHAIDIDGSIQSSQAFMTYFTDPSNPAFGSSTIKETDKNTATDNLAFRPAAPETPAQPLEDTSEQFRTNLYAMNSDGTTSLEDGVLDVYNNTYSDSVNFLEDAPKLGNISETIGLFREGHNLAIESRKIIGITDTVYYSLFGMQQKTYIIQFEATGLDHPGLAGFLIDSFLHTRTPLNLVGTTNYKFTVSANTASAALHRFAVIFVPAEGGPLPVTFINVKAALQTDKTIAVQWAVANQLNINTYQIQKSTDGIHFTTISTVTASGGNSASFITYNGMDKNAVIGNNYYRIVSVETNGAVSYSSVVNVKVDAVNSLITVYPNPVQDNVIGLQLINMPSGRYGIRLLDNIGQLILKDEITHDTINPAEPLKVGKTLAKGVYHLEVTGPDGSANDVKVIY